MSADLLQRINGAVSTLTAAGEPFALEDVVIRGYTYRSYVNQPANLGQYFALMGGHGDKPFVVCQQERYSYGEALQLAAQFGAALQQRYQVGKGDRVAIAMRNNPQWLIAFIGAVSVGAIVVPMNAWWTSEELQYGLRDSGARLIVVDPQRAAREFPPCTLMTVPLFHATGSHSQFMMSVVIGRKIVMLHKWDAQEALRLIEAERVTNFNGVPTMSAELQAAAVNSDYDLSSLREILSGGAARPPDQVKKISDTFTRSSPGSGYGLTETNALGAVNMGSFYLAKPGSTGCVVPAVTDFKIIDEQGFLYLVDRIKDIIIRGGENISCIEVEAAIHLHEGVEEVAVFGLPDERLGEVVGAAVVLRKNTELEVPQLQQYLAEHLASFKIPQHIWLRRDKLPRIASGKTFKRQLKVDYAAELINQQER